MKPNDAVRVTHTVDTPVDPTLDLLLRDLWGKVVERRAARILECAA